MIRAAILFAVLFSYVSCAYLDDIFKVSIMKAIRAAEMNLTNTGKVENCAAPSAKESEFSITWDPEPIVRGKPVKVAGSITFSEDFVSGVLSVTTDLYSSDFPVKCSDLGAKSCKKGETVTTAITQIVPTLIPEQIKEIVVTAKLKTSQHEILCAKADIHIQ